MCILFKVKYISEKCKNFGFTIYYLGADKLKVIFALHKLGVHKIRSPAYEHNDKYDAIYL